MKYIHSKYYINIKERFTEILSPIPYLAKDLHKEIPVIYITGDDLEIEKEGYELISKVYIHLLRNSMDHGIEPPELRQKLGKTAAGKMHIKLTLDGGFLNIVHQDDGRGLNLEALTEADKALITANPVKEGGVSETRTSAQTADLIFKSGLSTASSLSDISGRGVGLNAVKSYLEKSGGSISIELLEENDISEYLPFNITIRLPGRFLAQHG